MFANLRALGIYLTFLGDEIKDIEDSINYLVRPIFALGLLVSFNFEWRTWQTPPPPPPFFGHSMRTNVRGNFTAKTSFPYDCLLNDS